jgi:hypothetical protein
MPKSSGRHAPCLSPVFPQAAGMRTKLGSGWWLGVVLLLAGCNYDSALTAKPTRKIDEQLLGVWMGGDDGKDAMSVRQLDDSTYVVAMDHDIYRAFHSDFAGVGFISVQELAKDRRYLFLTAVVSPDGRTLTIRTVNTKVVPEETKGRADLQKLVKANLANPVLYNDALVFTRKP